MKYKGHQEANILLLSIDKTTASFPSSSPSICEVLARYAQFCMRINRQYKYNTRYPISKNVNNDKKLPTLTHAMIYQQTNPNPNASLYITSIKTSFRTLSKSEQTMR